MKQIDLDPHDYRLKGTRRIVPSILHKPVFMKVATLSGVWLPCALYAPAAGIQFGPWWSHLLVAAGPGIVLGIMLLVFDD